MTRAIEFIVTHPRYAMWLCLAVAVLVGAWEGVH